MCVAAFSSCFNHADAFFIAGRVQFSIWMSYNDGEKEMTSQRYNAVTYILYLCMINKIDTTKFILKFFVQRKYEMSLEKRISTVLSRDKILNRNRFVFMLYKSLYIYNFNVRMFSVDNLISMALVSEYVFLLCILFISVAYDSKNKFDTFHYRLTLATVIRSSIS